MLDKYNKTKSPFKVPENYFDDFNTNIMSKLPEKQTVKVVPLWKKIVPWTAVAAVVAGVLFTVNTFQSDTSNMVAQQSETIATGASIAMTSITEDDYYAFLEEEASSDYYMDVFYGDEL